jgi:hypothetical protein
MRFGTKPALMLVFVLVLTACGGGGDEGGAPVQPAPPPAAPTPPPVIGASGGTVTEVSGASVVVPEGAVTTSTTIRVAMDSTGAPALPAGLTAAGNTYVITPHDTEFAVPVEVRIPAPTAALQPNQQYKVAKASPGGEWLVLDDTEVAGGTLSADVSSFSYFMSVVVTYQLPILQAEPFKASSTLTCGNNRPCTDVVGPVTATYTVVGNGGPLPQGCAADSLQIVHADGWSFFSPSSGTARRVPISLSGGSVTLNLPSPHGVDAYSFGVAASCGSWQLVGGNENRRTVEWKRVPDYPRVAVLGMPAQLDVVEGLVANLDAIMGGGGGFGTAPTPTDRATVDWQRSDDGGASWRVIARSYQDEGNGMPFATGREWWRWSVRHGFVATATDQGAQIRAQVCYTPPTGTAAPCHTGSATVINVLQQSALPAIATAPRSVLVRTGQTANLSATATGLPAPTLQWQTRAANSNDSWSNVTTGTGATGANYTTAATTLADNGVQYRVVATNALGTSESIGVTVSVRDLDVAPTIISEPAGLSVIEGSDAVFAVMATGTEALSYQWTFNGAEISGANSAVLRLTAITGASAGSYSVTVSNNAGDAESTAAMLTVTAGTPAVVAPTIVTQPNTVIVNAGNTATFAVGVDGSGPFTFQWRREGVNIVGATSAVYTVNSVQLPHAGAYSVVVSNTAGAIVSDNAVLDVTAAVTGVAPSITTQPATMILPLGGSSIMAVGATGSGPLTYQWYQNGAPIPFATQPVLNFYQVTADFVGSYTVTVTNSVSSRTSQVAELILLGAPTITQQPTATTANEGGTATFSVSANGSNLRYQWLANGASIPGADQATYTTPALVVGNSGAVYSVIVFNAAGLVFSQSAVLTVQVVPSGLTGTTLVSAALGGGPSGFSRHPSISADGNLVAFISNGIDLVPGTTVSGHAYVRNLATGMTTLIDQTPAGGESSRAVQSLKLAAGGRYAVFTSDAGDLVPGDTNDNYDVFRRDLQTGTTIRLSVLPNGDELPFGPLGNGDYQLDVSGDGRGVLFRSYYDLTTDGHENARPFLYYRDVVTGATRLIAGNAQYASAYSAISDNGAWIVHTVGVPPPGTQSVNLYDVAADAHYSMYDIDQSSVPQGLLRQEVSVSNDGRYVAFAMTTVSSPMSQVYVVDRNNPGVPILVSTGASGAGDGNSAYPRLSGDGRYVAFSTDAPNLTVGQAWQSNFFLVVRDLVAGTTTIGSRKFNGTGVALGAPGDHGYAISQDGSTLTFVADYAAVNGGGTNVGSKVFAGPRP